jgi:hypothetical protein
MHWNLSVRTPSIHPCSLWREIRPLRLHHRRSRYTNWPLIHRPCLLIRLYGSRIPQSCSLSRLPFLASIVADRAGNDDDQDNGGDGGTNNSASRSRILFVVFGFRERGACEETPELTEPRI